MTSALQWRRLSPPIGVEIEGLDLRRALEPDQEAELRRLLDEHQMLLFRRQRIEAEHQVRVLGLFGKVSDESGDGKRHTFVSNVLPDGLFGDLPLAFHSDFAFVSEQPALISLYGLEVGAACGPTLFANCIRAARRLPEPLRARLDSMTVVQVARFAGGNDTAAKDNRSRILGLQALPADSSYRMSRHPVLKPHPRTGQPALFVSEKHSSHIEGLEAEESRPLVRSLCARLYAEDNIHTHRWEEGDLLIWDNLALQHARPALSGGGPECRRTLRRVLVSAKTARELLGGAAYGADG